MSMNVNDLKSLKYFAICHSGLKDDHVPAQQATFQAPSPSRGCTIELNVKNWPLETSVFRVMESASFFFSSPISWSISKTPERRKGPQHHIFSEKTSKSQKQPKHHSLPLTICCVSLNSDDLFSSGFLSIILGQKVGSRCETSLAQALFHNL